MYILFMTHAEKNNPQNRGSTKSIRESRAQAFEWLREASKMLSIRTIGNGWTGNSRSENMKCRSVNLVLKE